MRFFTRAFPLLLFLAACDGFVGEGKVTISRPLTVVKSPEPLPAPRTPAASTALGVLSRKQPLGVSWRYSQNLDINCDGADDEVFTARDEQRFYVAAVLGPISDHSQSSIVSFGLSGESQDSFCGDFESLEPELLSTREEMIEMLGEEPVGYRYSEKCHELRLVAGQCDSFHLFWNHTANTLDWWRL